MRGQPKYRPPIPLKPLTCMVPSTTLVEGVVHGVMGWAFIHPKTLVVHSNQETLGSNVLNVPEEVKELFRGFTYRWPYKDKMRVHYPFVRAYEDSVEGRLEHAGLQGIRAYCALNDYRLSCSQLAFACAHITGKADCSSRLLLRRLLKLGHVLEPHEIPRAHALAFLYYEQRNVFNPIRDKGHVRKRSEQT